MLLEELGAPPVPPVPLEALLLAPPAPLPVLAVVVVLVLVVLVVLVATPPVPALLPVPLLAQPAEAAVTTEAVRTSAVKRLLRSTIAAETYFFGAAGAFFSARSFASRSPISFCRVASSGISAHSASSFLTTTPATLAKSPRSLPTSARSLSP